MDFAAQAEQVGHFFEVKVFNPVLDVGGAPERDDDGVSRCRVADVSWGLSEVENDVADISEWIVGTGFAGPVLETGPGTVGHGGEDCVFL